MKTKLLTLATISSLALSIGTQTFASPLLNKMPRAYQNLINKEIKPIVLRGLNNKYLDDQTYLQRFGSTTEPKDLYFSLKDLDNNGVDELIIGTKDGWIYELYTIDKKGKLKQIEDILTNKFNERYQQYQSIADIIVDIKNAPVEENFKTLLGALSIK